MNEFTDLSIDWIKKQKAADKPFFLWYNPSRMHQKIHVSGRVAGQKRPHRIHRRDHAARLLWSANCSRLSTIRGLAKNTIVLFTSDNGVNLSHWPDSGAASFRGEKGLTWDGGFRVPMLVRWPGNIKPNTWTGEFMTSVRLGADP